MSCVAAAAISILLVVTALATEAAPLVPIDCSSRPSLNVSSFGEYIWNCSSSAGDGDVLRIVVPPPTANATGMLLVEVRLSTFQQIIVDLGNVGGGEVVDVNVTVVLCGAPAVTNGNTVSLLNFSNRPLIPVVHVVNPRIVSNSSAGGVRVMVAIEVGTLLWLHNVSSLVSVSAFPTSALWGEITLEVRMGCRVEMYEVASLMAVLVAIPERMTVRLTATRATVTSTTSDIASPTAGLLARVTSSTPSRRCDPSGTTYLTAVECNITVSHPLSGSLLFLVGNFSLVGAGGSGYWCSCIANIVVSLIGTTVDMTASAAGNLLSSSAPVMDVSEVDVTVQNSNISFARVGGFVKLHAIAYLSCRGFRIAHTSGSVLRVAGNGSLLFAEAPNGAIVVADVELSIVGSAAFFAGEGYLLFTTSFNDTEARGVSATMLGSSLTSALGSLCLFLQAFGTVLRVSNTSIAVGPDSVVTCAAKGLLLSATSGSSLQATNVTVSLDRSNMTVGQSPAALLYFWSLGDVQLSHLFVALKLATTRFVGNGFLVFAFAQDRLRLLTVHVTGNQSGMMVGGPLGSLCYLESARRDAIVTGAQIGLLERSSLQFAGQGYLLRVQSAATLNGSGSIIEVHSSNLTAGRNGVMGAVCAFESTAGDVNLNGVSVFLDGGAVVSFSDVGYLLLSKAFNSMCVSSTVCSAVTGSAVWVNGSTGALISLWSTNGTVTLNSTHSIAITLSECITSFVAVGFLWTSRSIAFATEDLHDAGVVVQVSSSTVSTGGVIGALCYLSTNRSMRLSSLEVVSDNSSLIFSGEGYFVVADAQHQMDVRNLVLAMTSSNMLVGGTAGGMCSIEAHNDSVSLANITTTLGGGSMAHFNGTGLLLSVRSNTTLEVFGLRVELSGKSRLVFYGDGALCYCVSVRWNTVVSDVIMLLDGGSAVYFASNGYIVFANSELQTNVSDILVIISSSRLDSNRMPAPFIAVESISGGLIINRLTLLMRSGSSAQLGGEGYLLYAASGTTLQASNVTVALNSSSVSVAGTTGILCSFYSATVVISGVVVVMNGTNAMAHFANAGYLLSVHGSGSISVSDVNISVSSRSIMLVGGSMGALGNFYSSYGAGRLEGVAASLDTQSIAFFNGEGYCIFAASETGMASVQTTATVSSSSNMMVRGKSGALLCLQSLSNMYLSGVIALLVEGSSATFDGRGYLTFVKSWDTSTLRNVSTAVSASIFSVTGSPSSLFYVQSVNASGVDATGVRVALELGSNATFMGQGFVAIVTSQLALSAHDIVVAVRSSYIEFTGVGTLCNLWSTAGGVSIDGVRATIDNASDALFRSDFYLIDISAFGDAVINRVQSTVSGSAVVAAGVGALCSVYVGGLSSLSLVDISALALSGSTLSFSGQGYLLFVVSEADITARGILTAIHASNLTANGTISALCYMWTRTGGGIYLINVTTLAGLQSLVAFQKGEGYLLVVKSLANSSVINMTACVNISSTFVAKGSMQTLVWVKSIWGTVNLSSVSVSILNGSTMTAYGEGYLLYVSAAAAVDASNVTAILSASSMAIRGQQGGLVYINGSDVLLRSVGIALSNYSVVTCANGGHLIVVQSATSSTLHVNVTMLLTTFVAKLIGTVCLLNVTSVTSFSSVAVVVSGSNVTFPTDGHIVLQYMGLIVEGLHNLSLHVRVSLSHSAAALKSFVQVVALSTLTLDIDHSRVWLTDNASSSLVSGAVPVVAVAVTSSTLLLAASRTKLLVLNHSPALYSQTSMEPVSRFTSSCLLMGWRIVSDTRLRGGVGNTTEQSEMYLHEHLDNLPFRFRALRKLDVAEVDIVSVTARRCAWRRGSNEFLTTDSATASLSELLSRSLTRGATTATVAPSITATRQMLVVARRFLVTTQGIGSIVLFVAAAASVVSSSVLTVPSIQVIGQSSALRRLCNAYTSATALDDSSGSIPVVPPLSDSASNPFGVTIGPLSDELMFAGGSIVSSLLLALIYAAIVMVVVPLLRGPRQWLLRMQAAPLAALRLPGSLYAPLALVLQPLTAAAVVLLVSSSRVVGSVALGLVVLAMTLVPLCVLLWRVSDGCDRNLAMWSKSTETRRNRAVGDTGSALLHMINRAFDDLSEVTPRFDDAASVQYVEQLGVVLSSYSAGRVWFVGVEIASTIVSGALSGVASGLDPSVVCNAATLDGFNWALAALCAALVATVAGLRPYSSHFGNAQCGSSSLFAALCLALQSLSPDSPAIAILTWTQSALGMLPAAVVIAAAFAENFSRRTPTPLNSIESTTDNVRLATTRLPRPPYDPLEDHTQHKHVIANINSCIRVRLVNGDSLVKLIQSICSQRKRQAAVERDNLEIQSHAHSMHTWGSTAKI